VQKNAALRTGALVTLGVRNVSKVSTKMDEGDISYAYSLFLQRQSLSGARPSISQRMDGKINEFKERQRTLSNQTLHCKTCFELG
jgi:hypothetical protein